MIYGKPITFSSGRVKIDIANYAVLPASGKQNQIALVNNVSINNVYIQPAAPDLFPRVLPPAHNFPMNLKCHSGQPV